MDVLRASTQSGIAWHENSNGKGTFGEQQVIAAVETATLGRSNRPVYAADVEGDGDMDVLTPSSWYENTDGSGSFGPEKLYAADVDGDWLVCAADLDGDGDVDVVTAVYHGRITWHKNLSRQAGDANRDDQFNRLDIVQVLQAAKYLSGGPATFQEGHWNGDGVFDQRWISWLRFRLGIIYKNLLPAVSWAPESPTLKVEADTTTGLCLARRVVSDARCATGNLEAIFPTIIHRRTWKASTGSSAGRGRRRHCGDLVRFFFGRHLPHSDALVGRPRTDNKQSAQFVLLIVRATKCFAIDGDLLLLLSLLFIQEEAKRNDPLGKATLEGEWFEHG